MKRALVAVVFVLLAAAAGAGCKKNVTPPPPSPGPVTSPDEPDPTPAAAPVIDISASPTTLERGGQTTLSWTSSNATSVTIDGGVGNVQSNGSIIVSPQDSITYTARATGPGGNDTDAVRVSVTSRPTTVVDRNIEQIWNDLESSGDIGPVFFAYDKAELSDEAKRQLERNAASFRNNPGFGTIVIEGHCDERGTEEYNLALGDRRAQAARDYLVQLGVSGSRLETISFGEERPFAEGSNEAAWRQNRRAHFVRQR